MIDLLLNIRLRVKIPEALNARLEDGEDAAFDQLAFYLTQALIQGGMEASHVTIDDAGEYNVSDEGME